MAGIYLHNPLWARTPTQSSKRWPTPPAEHCSTSSAGTAARTWPSCAGPLAMTRQSATQHLDVLEAANLVSVVRRAGRSSTTSNPVPLWEIQERWIGQFEPPRLRSWAM